MLAARRSLAVVVSVRVNRRGEGRAATELNVRMTSVGARRCGQDGARCARRRDRCALDKVGGADKERRARGSALARRRRVSSSEQARRGQSSNGAEREDDVGRRSAVRPERRTLRTYDTISARSTRSAALTRSDVLAARRSLAVVVSVRVNRRGEGRAATELNGRVTSVGARRCGRDGARCARRRDRCALDKVGGADKERRARGSALARRRRVSSSEQARRGQSSNGAEREDDVGRRSAVRPERRTLRTYDDTIGARSTRSAALTRNYVLAARRSLAVVVSVRVNRRGEGGAATELNVRITSVGARRCGQNGARCARRHGRCALDKVGGADK